MQLAPVLPAHVPPVQIYDVAAGVQTGVRREASPAATDVGEAFKVQLGAAVLVVPNESKAP